MSLEVEVCKKLSTLLLNLKGRKIVTLSYDRRKNESESKQRRKVFSKFHELSGEERIVNDGLRILTRASFLFCLATKEP